ncbi:MAC/perforin domain-containing protein [Desertivirga xinjiangensis]|uniref:MAC/perforin domain-containing protein n=1 Tax=Desertivirga xinjiangensis TaxID=539206 RepID=UPI0034E21730
MVQTQSAQYIVNTYGTHILADISLGGVLEVLYQAESYSTFRKDAAEVGVHLSVLKVFSINAGSNKSTSLANNSFFQTIRYKTAGGDPSVAVSGSISVDPNATIIPINTTNWQNSCTQANADLIDLKPSSLIPIYDLIADPVKKAAVKDYVDQYLINNGVTIFDEKPPIYQYYSSGSTGYQYFLESNRASSWWAYEGQQFNSVSGGALGAVPIFVYQNDQLEDWIYSPLDQDQIYLSYASSAPYNNKGPRFFGYTTQKQGTIPLYLHCRQNNEHFLSTTSWFPNMKSTKIAFYGFPMN